MLFPYHKHVLCAYNLIEAMYIHLDVPCTVNVVSNQDLSGFWWQKFTI